jgi:hypothetical protein
MAAGTAAFGGRSGLRVRKQLESGTYETIEELAAAEKINSSYVSRILRLTLLAPPIVEVILDGRQPTEITLAVLMRPFGLVWQEQQYLFACRSLPRSPRRLTAGW